MHVRQLRGVRERRGWSQQQLADELEKLGEPIDKTTIAKIEAGRRRVMADDIFTFALALGVSPMYLLLPRATAPVELASGLTVAGWEALAWARGMYCLDLIEAPDTAQAALSPEVRLYYESVPDYEAAAIRRAPLVRDIWHMAALAMSYAADDQGDEHLRRQLRQIKKTAAAALAALDAKEEQ